MTLTLATLLALFLPAMCVLAAAALFHWKIGAIRRNASDSWDWNVEMSVDRYRPMFRLLDGQDIRFMRSQPGVTSEMIHRLRRQRCQVFRGYLRCLELDFSRACQALMLVAIQSQADQKDLLKAIVAARAKFVMALFVVRCRLVLYRWNVGQQSVVRLVNLFEGLQLELIAVAPLPEGARA